MTSDRNSMRPRVRAARKARLGAVAAAALIACAAVLALPPSPGAAELHQGRVASRGAVLRDPSKPIGENVACNVRCVFSGTNTLDATCTPCSEGRRTWVEYNQFNNPIRRSDSTAIDYRIPEPARYDENAFVMSAADYLRYRQQLEAAAAQHGRQPRPLEGLTCTNDEGEVVDAQPPESQQPRLVSSSIFNPVVRTVITSRDVGPCSGMILFGSPLHPQMLHYPTRPDTASLLVEKDTWRVLYESEFRIGLETAFMSFDSVEEAPLCASAVDHQEDSGRALVENFQGCPPSAGFLYTNQTTRELRIWAPIPGVQVEFLNGYTYVQSTTDEYGLYQMNYRAAAQPMAGLHQFSVFAKMLFHRHEPRSPSSRVFYMNGISQLDHATGLSYRNFALDLAMVRGSARLSNAELGGPDIKIIGITNYDPTRGILNFDTANSPTIYDYTAYLDVTEQTTASDPRYQAQGLLKHINVADTRDSEIYVFRASTGDLVGSRWGLLPSEVGELNIAPDQLQFVEPYLQYTALLRGPRSMPSPGTQASFEPSNAAVTPPDQLQGVFIHDGEVLKVYIVNRATGYIGSGLATVNMLGGQATIDLGEIQMRPPNLKVEVTRDFTVEHGANVDQDRTQIIGFEGSGLTSDTAIKITTTWLDQDDQPLPDELPGYTGRLAQIVAAAEAPDGTPTNSGLPSGLAGSSSGELCAPGDPSCTRTQLGMFPIKPNQSTAVVRLPQAGADRLHFYLHVDAQPLERTVDFTGNAIPDKPTFSVNEVCYSCGDYFGDGCQANEQLGVGGWACIPRNANRYADEDSALRQRPVTYVPFQVRVFDKLSTDAERRAARENHQPTPAPVYAWVYRPEMQFSVLSLTLEHLYKTAEDGQQVDILDTFSILESADGTIEIIYRALTDDLQQLQTFGPPRKLVFQLGERTVDAQLFPDPQENASHASFQNFDVVSDLDPEDLVTLRLVQLGDEANVLWEYRFNDIDIVLEDDRGSIPPGEAVHALALTDPEDMTVEWEILDRDEGVVVHKRTAERAEGGASRVLLEAAEDSAEGFITLRATDTEDPNVFGIAKIYIGCECRSCIAAGTCNNEPSSVHTRFNLGNAPGGGPAGQIFLEADELSADSFTPKALEFYTTTLATEDLYDDHGLRQVRAPETFVDILHDPGTPGFTLAFYSPDAAGEQDEDTGLYAVNGTPFATWRVEPGSGGDNTLRLTGQREDDPSPEVVEYTLDDGGSTTLSTGGGERVEERTETIDGPERRVRTRVKNGQGHVASDVEQVFRSYAWGEELVREVVDPDGAALTTTMTYFESIDPSQGAYTGQLATIVRPGGSWTRFYYDDHGRTTSEVHAWLEAPPNAPESQARVVRYTYGTDANATHPDFRRPRSVTELVEGIEVSRTLFDLTRDGIGGARIEVEERCVHQNCQLGDPDNLRTERHYAAVDARDPQRNDSGKLQRVVHPDGRVETYSYERGTIQSGSLAAGDGDALRTTRTHGTLANPDGVPYETTREVTLTDERGNVIREESYVYTGGGYELLGDTTYEYDAFGRLRRTVKSNGEITEEEWGCCTQERSVDSRGIETLVLSRDGLDRVISEQRAGVTTTYSYDAEGRRLTTTRTGGLFSLTSSQQYDEAGRLERSTDEQGLETQYVYEEGGRRTIVTQPGGFTEITERYADRQTKSTTGTAVVAQYVTHGVNLDGTRWTKVQVARPDSPASERTTVDMLGRTIRVERPGFNGTIEVAETFYNEKGQVERTTATGMADTLYVYDDHGELVRTVLDNVSPGIDLASTDRISETDRHFELVDGAWWSATVQRVYPDTDSARVVTTATTRTRLTGFGGGVISEQVSEDVHGNEIRTRTIIDRGQRTETRVTDVPESTIDATAVTRDGLLRSTTSATGVTVTYDYDGLHRRTFVIDPRTGPSETSYDANGRVEFVADAAGHRTFFGYDGATGRKVSECNALGNCSYFDYDARGQLTRTWGDVPYPVQYVYDDYGRRTHMHTFRQDLGFAELDWPDGTSMAADVTSWEYEEATGLLLAKRDAAGEAVTYTYEAAGRLRTRTWARPRQGSGQLVTTYGYDQRTGELLSVDYNDSTPDVGYTYDRLGRQTNVTDAVGTRTFVYNPDTLQLETETIGGLTPAVLTRTYASSGPVLGRPSGMTLGAGYAVTYGYAANGRFETLGWTVNGSSDAATYAYVPGSELLAGYTTGSGLAVGYAYDPARDLKTRVATRWNGSLVSQYDYRYDAIGRRTSVETSGSAFASGRFTAWGYDERNQVTASNRYTGAFTAMPSPANEVAGERRAYDYDPIGNRKSALDQDGATSISYAANELNQYDAVGSASPAYDEDGNLLDDGTKVLSYNAENQLVRVEAPGVSVSTYDYDYMGRRVRKSVDLVTGDDYEVRWVYSGWNKVEERRTVGSTMTTKNFIWGLDLSQSIEGAGGIGGLIAVVDGSGSASLLAYDGNGNVSELVAADTGATDAHYEYDAFGNVIFASGTDAAQNCYRFSTKYADDETGLVYYGYRYFESATGRWPSRDPLNERGGLNLYAFVSNDPIGASDPTGLKIIATCDIGALLDAYEVSPGARDVSNGLTTYSGRSSYRRATIGSDGSVTNSELALRSEILGRMIESSRTFVVDSPDGLKANLFARANIVRVASEERINFRAGDPRNFVLPPEYELRPDLYGPVWRIREGEDAVLASRSAAGIDSTLTACTTAVGCEYATEIVMTAGSLGSPRVEITVSPGGAEDWVPGDTGFIQNSQPKPRFTGAAFRGENIIYVGGGQFWGHLANGPTYRTYGQWFATVSEWGVAKHATNRISPTVGLVGVTP